MSQENQEQWIAYELHDGLLQWVISARMTLENLIAKDQSLSQSSPCDGVGEEDSLSNSEQVQEAHRMLVAASEEGRQLIQFLENQPSTGALNLQLSLGNYIDSLLFELERNSQECHFEPAELALALDPRESWNLLRIVQQAISNAMRHAGPCTIRVTMGEEAGRWFAQVVDTGTGFDLSRQAASGHYGLPGMRHRANLIGAQLKLESSPERGTTIRVTGG